MNFRHFLTLNINGAFLGRTMGNILLFCYLFLQTVLFLKKAFLSFSSEPRQFLKDPKFFGNFQPRIPYKGVSYKKPYSACRSLFASLFDFGLFADKLLWAGAA